jgi:hypothetical protein
MAGRETSEHTLGSGVVGAKGEMIMHAEGREGQYVIHTSITPLDRATHTWLNAYDSQSYSHA